jgi:hypothetical protein
MSLDPTPIDADRVVQHVVENDPHMMAAMRVVRRHRTLISDQTLRHVFYTAQRIIEQDYDDLDEEKQALKDAVLDAIAKKRLPSDDAEARAYVEKILLGNRAPSSGPSDEQTFLLEAVKAANAAAAALCHADARLCAEEACKAAAMCAGYRAAASAAVYAQEETLRDVRGAFDFAAIFAAAKKHEEEAQKKDMERHGLLPASPADAPSLG